MHFKKLFVSATLLGAAYASHVEPVKRLSANADTVVTELETLTSQVASANQIVASLSNPLSLTGGAVDLLVQLRTIVQTLLQDLNVLGLGTVENILSPQLLQVVSGLLGGLGTLLGGATSGLKRDATAFDLATSTFSQSDQLSICSIMTTLIQTLNTLVQGLTGTSGVLAGLAAPVANLLSTITQIVNNLLITVIEVVPVCGQTSSQPLNLLLSTALSLVSLLGGAL